MLVTDAMPLDRDVLACGPEPMLEAVRALAPGAQLAWEAPMACGYGACYGCVVPVDGALDRLCVEGPGAVLLLNASGCLDALAAPEVARSLDAFVTKTVTPEPREGNPPVRIAETDAGMLNSIGLANPGRERFLGQTLPRLAGRSDMPIWVSVGGFSARDYAETCAQLDRDASRPSSSTSRARTSTRRPSRRRRSSPPAGRRPSLPLYAKLSPAAWDIAEVARAVEAAGADGLSLVNTIRGLALDGESAAAARAAASGGYSGPALKPIALAAVLRLPAGDRAADRRHGRRPTGRDALELIACGATHVALGTVLFADPDAPARVRAELADALASCRL